MLNIESILNKLTDDREDMERFGSVMDELYRIEDLLRICGNIIGYEGGESVKKDVLNKIDFYIN